MLRFTTILLACFYLAAPAAAQDSAEIGQMRLYIQQLEERLRQLTGQNEQLTYQLNQLRAQAGQAGAGAAAGAQTGLPSQAGVGQTTGAVAGQAPAGDPIGAQAAMQQPGSIGAAAPPQDLGTYSIAPDDPLIAPDGGDPVDLSVLAGGGTVAGDPNAPVAQPGLPAGQQTAVVAPPAPTAALSGEARDEYDLAYGYVLTGEYELAEQSFERWLAAFPGDPQAVDAQFWLAESQYQQGDYRDAANAFLAVYKSAGQSPKAPDALLKLGMSLSALGEKNAACATLSEVGRKYPSASPALMSRVDAESERAGC